jgi:hypothetical protein
VVELVQVIRLPEGEHVFRPPGPFQRLGDRRRVVPALRVPQSRQGPRVPFPGQDRRDDPLAGLAGDVGHHLGQLDVELLQRLLHVLGVAGGVPDLHLSLPVVAAQGQDRVRRPERRPEQAVRVQPLDPLGVQHVGLGPGPAPGQLAGLDQPDLEPPGLE